MYTALFLLGAEDLEYVGLAAAQPFRELELQGARLAALEPAVGVLDGSLGAFDGFEITPDMTLEVRRKNRAAKLEDESESQEGKEGGESREHRGGSTPSVVEPAEPDAGGRGA